MALQKIRRGVILKRPSVYVISLEFLTIFCAHFLRDFLHAFLLAFRTPFCLIHRAHRRATKASKAGRKNSC